MLEIAELFIASVPKGFTYTLVDEEYMWIGGEVEQGSVLIDLLNHFKLASWRPRAITYKEGGIMQSSSIGDKSRLVMHTYDNQTESFQLVVRAGHQRGAINDLRRLRNVLERAADYHTGWSSTTVYIAARAMGENNLRYALVVRGVVPEDPNPYAAPFTRDGDGRSVGIVELTLEHFPWQHGIPGKDKTDVEVLAYQNSVAADIAFDADLGTVLADGTPDGRTDGSAFVGNKSDYASLTRMFYTTAAAPGYSGNIIADPFVNATLFDNPPNVGDALYIGSLTTAAYGGNFCSVVFYITTAAAGFTVTWEYYNGGWVALPAGYFDETGGFTRLGYRSLHFTQPSAAVAVANPLTSEVGYWIRARVTAAPGPITRPTIANFNPYTVIWASVLIESDQVGGDLPALALIRPIQRFNDAKLAKYIIGMRSVQRGPAFNAYINLSTGLAHNTGVQIIYSSGALTSVADLSAGALKKTLFSSATAATATLTVRLLQSSNMPPQYRGTFRAYVRCSQALASAGDITIQLRARYKDAPWVANDLAQVDYITELWQLVDLGKVDIITTLKEDEDIYTDFDLELLFSANAAAVAASATMSVWDLILMPVDEWAGEFYDETGLLYMDGLTSGATTYHDLLDIDAITNPKIDTNVVMKQMTSTTIASPTPTPSGSKGEWIAISNHYPILQVGRDQRLWFIQVECTSSKWHAYPWLVSSLQVFKAQRYSSMRGTE